MSTNRLSASSTATMASTRAPRRTRVLETRGTFRATTLGIASGPPKRMSVPLGGRGRRAPGPLLPQDATPALPDRRSITAVMPITTLQGLRVVDLSDEVQGAYPTRCMGAHGAPVVQAEPPEGGPPPPPGPR